MWISVHMGKTGGTSFRKFLQHVFPSQVCFDYGGLIDSNQRPLTAPPPGTRCIHGHFRARKYAATPGAFFITWLRDPVERALSHFHYWQRFPDPKNPVFVGLRDAGYTLDAFIRHPALHDIYAASMAPLPLEDWAFVGITEEYDRGIQMLCRMWGVKPPRGLRATNVNQERGGARYAINPAERALIEGNNPRDVELYRRAVERFKRAVAAASP